MRFVLVFVGIIICAQSAIAQCESNFCPLSSLRPINTWTNALPAPVIHSTPVVRFSGPYSVNSSCWENSRLPARDWSGSAIREVNQIRSSGGLPVLIEDPSLTAIAYRKANIQASRGAMFHPGGSMGSARYEGVGTGSRFSACYLGARNVRYAGAATVIGRDGRKYHALLVR